VAVSFFVDELALEERAVQVVVEVAEFVRAGRQLDRQHLTVLVWNVLADEFPDVDPHLFVRFESLFQIIPLGSLIIEEGETRAGWLKAAVANRDEGIVLRVVLPHAAFPGEGKLVGEWSLRALPQVRIVTGSDGQNFIRLAVGGERNGGPVGALRQRFVVLKRCDIDAARFERKELQ